MVALRLDLVERSLVRVIDAHQLQVVRPAQRETPRRIFDLEQFARHCLANLFRLGNARRRLANLLLRIQEEELAHVPQILRRVSLAEFRRQFSYIPAALYRVVSRCKMVKRDSVANVASSRVRKQKGRELRPFEGWR